MRTKGFTLIELLVVISIIGLISSIVMASLSTSRDKARIAAGLVFERSILGARGDVLHSEINFDANSTFDSAGNTTSGGSGSYSTDTPTGKGRSLVTNGTSVSIFTNVSETSYAVGFWFKTAIDGQFNIQYPSTGAHDREIYLSGGNICLRLWSSTNEESVCSTSKNYIDNKWHYVLHTYGGSTGGQEAYVDGVRVVKGSKNFSGFNWEDRASVGQFTGLIDNVRIYSTAFAE